MKEMAMCIAEKRDIEMCEVTDEMVGEELKYRAKIALLASDSERKKSEYLEKDEELEN